MAIHFDLTKVSDETLTTLLRHIERDIEELDKDRLKVVTERIRRSGMNQMSFYD